MSFELRDVWLNDPKAVGGSSRWALTGASVVVPPGRKIALMGAEKSKTTAVLRLLAAVEEPERGVVRRVGAPCWPFDYSDYVDGNATVRQNANFLAQVYGVDGEDVASIAARLSGVNVVRGRSMRIYSKGDRGALRLGLALAFRFDWYFVDQQLPSGPQQTADLVHAAISDRFRDAAVIWATNSPEDLTGYCDAGLVLDQGLLTFYDDVGDAISAYRQTIESGASTQNERKSRHPDRRRGPSRRTRKNDPEEPR